MRESYCLSGVLSPVQFPMAPKLMLFALQPYASSHVKPKLHEAVEVHFSAWLELQYLVEFNTPGEDDTVVMPVQPSHVEPVPQHCPKRIRREQRVQRPHR